MSARWRQSGFTLVEVLVATALLVVVVGAAATSQQLAWRSASSATHAAARAEMETRALRLTAEVITLANDGPDTAMPLVADPDRLLMLSRVPAASGRSGEHWIELVWRPDGESGRLVLRGWPIRAGARHRGRNTDLPDGPPDFERELWRTEGIGKFEYARSPARPGDVRWKSRWSGERQWPALIRLSATRANGRKVERVVAVRRWATP